MPLDHSNATAIVSVKGLALSCYNTRTSEWEVGFIRAAGHELRLDVTRQTPGGPENLSFKPDDNHQIYLDVRNAIPPADPLYTPMETFDRTATDNIDLEDFRWVVDFEKELNNGEAVALINPNQSLTPLRVPQPKLYADSKNLIHDGTLIRQADRSEVRPFPRLSEAAQADITCGEGGGLVLRVEGPNGFTLNFPYLSGGPAHEIKFDNTCEPPAGTSPEGFSDFARYYDVITETAGEKFDIRLPDEGHGEGAVCNTGFLGVSERLFQTSAASA